VRKFEQERSSQRIFDMMHSRRNRNRSLRGIEKNLRPESSHLPKTISLQRYQNFKENQIQSLHIPVQKQYKMAPTTQPWKSVWPPAGETIDGANIIPDGLSAEEVTNQRAFGSHASNTKGRIVHITSN